MTRPDAGTGAPSLYGKELTPNVRSAAQSLALGGGVMTLVASLGLLVLDHPPLVLIPAVGVGMALNLLGILLLVLFLPDRARPEQEIS